MAGSQDFQDFEGRDKARRTNIGTSLGRAAGMQGSPFARGPDSPGMRHRAQFDEYGETPKRDFRNVFQQPWTTADQVSRTNTSTRPHTAEPAARSVPYAWAMTLLDVQRRREVEAMRSHHVVQQTRNSWVQRLAAPTQVRPSRPARAYFLLSHWLASRDV